MRLREEAGQKSRPVASTFVTLSVWTSAKGSVGVRIIAVSLRRLSEMR